MKPPIVFFPDPVLRRKAAKITLFDTRLAALVDTLDRVMRSQPHGIGIAAPQIGEPLAVALVDVSSRVEKAARIVLVNPEVLEEGPEVPSREGCMSLPDYTADLIRRKWVRVKWQDARGGRHERIFKGIEGVCVQHEIDHLNGRLFLDRVACLKTDMYPRKMKRKR